MYYIIWFLLLFISFEGLGLRSLSWGGLGLSSLGWYGFLQLIVLGMSLIVPFLFKSKFFFDPKRKIGLPAKLIILLLIVIIIQSLVISVFSSELPIIELFSNLAKMKYILLYFIFVYLLSRPNGIKIALRSIVFWSLISSLIVIFIVITGYESKVIKVLISTAVGREFRTLLPTAMLITIGYFYLLTKFRFQKKIIYLVGILIFIIAILLQMHRSVLTFFILTTLFALFKLYGLKIKNTFYLLIITGVIFIGVNIAFNQVKYSSEQIIETIIYTKEEIASTSGNFAVRLFLPINSFNHVIKNYFILGAGLNWKPITNIHAYRQLTYYATPTYDSGYNNIIIIYGLLGIFVYIFLLIRLFQTINYIIKHTHNIEYRLLAYSLLFTLIYIILIGFASDTFILQPSAVIFVLIISLTYVLESKIKNEE